MRGLVEIYQDNKKVSESENMIVDGGAELLADIMTISPSISNIPSASALLDTSNYTIQAASFGKDPASYLTNCHSSSILELSSIYNIASQRYEFYITNTSGATSSFIPINGLPQYANSLDTQLQNIPSSILPYIEDYGQNLNIFGLWRKGLSAVPIFSSLNLSTAALFGCYPAFDSGGNRLRVFLKDSSGLNLIASAIADTYNATISFNPVSSIDWRGFINRDGSNDNKGLLLAALESEVSSLGKVTFKIKLLPVESRFANLYGGISTMGLWYIDVKETLKNGVVPPFEFNILYPVREYKLFSKKIFNQNICQAFDNGTNAGLVKSGNVEITWSLFFI